MTAILAIDPGTTRSAWVLRDQHGMYGRIEPNEQVLERCRWFATVADTVPEAATDVVIEKVESFGMAVGAEVFETVFWSGRFAEAARPLPVHRIGRRDVKLHLCGQTRAKDPNVRQALVDRFGGPLATRKGGALYGVKGDIWAALAVAVTWADLHP